MTYQERLALVTGDDIPPPALHGDARRTELSAGTVFPVLSLDRGQVRWEDYAQVLTPVTHVDGSNDGVFYKREDYFAPLGYGGINGSKLRQCIWLLHGAARAGYAGVLSAGSVKSPQHAMVATVARHYGLRSYHVLGATKPETCGQHDSVAIAQSAGAAFEFITVGYNAALQRRVKDLQASDEFQNYFRLEYAISVDHEREPAARVAQFHTAGASQVLNLPDTRRLIVPAGSCNTAASILWGVIGSTRQSPAEIHLVGVGHNRMLWLRDRLDILGARLTMVGRGQWELRGFGHQPRKVVYHDLVGAGYTEYQQMWSEQMGGITMHPTYEAKVARWLRTQRPDLLQDACFWVVGSEPKHAVMKGVFA